MSGIFDFLGMADNYESRCVGRYEDAGLLVSTASVTDGAQPFETAVKHPLYNRDKIVIVEAYAARAAAENGHARWVAKMTAAELPNELVDCCNAEIAALLSAAGDRMVYKRAQVAP